MEIVDGGEYVDQTLVKLDLQSVILKNIEFEAVCFKYCNFRESILENVRFIDCEFHESDISLCKAKYTQFLDVHFIECRAVGINWTQIQNNLGISIEFSNSILDDSIFAEVDFKSSKIDHCQVKRCVFSHSNLQKVNFQYSDLEGTVFQQVDLRKADFRYAHNYFIDILGTNKLKGAQFSQIEATNLLKSLEIEIE